MSLCQLLAIDVPIIQAPMAGVQDWELAAAVANAGGLGSIPCGMLTLPQIEAEIIAFKQASDKPYNLNFFCHDMPPLDKPALDEWQAALGDYYRALEVSPPTDVGALRVPFNQATADLLAPHQPPVLSFHFGLPSAELVAQIKSWGSVIMSSATTLEEGLWLEQHGADIVIAQGNEAGGHRAMFLSEELSTQISTSVLVDALNKQLSIPVVAAGGIATNEHIAPMLALGAQGVQIGTSYLLCDEAKTSSVHRAALKSEDGDTAITNIYSGRPARGIINKLTQTLGFMSDKAPVFPYASIAIAPLRTKAESLNLPDCSPLWCGEDRRGCAAISATALTQQLACGITTR